MLEKAAPVPSTTPLRAVKSSAWFWLKLPHRPSDRSQEVSRLFNLATFPQGCHFFKHDQRRTGKKDPH